MPKLTVVSRLLLIAAAALLISSLFMAIWRIELEAPQYPEGLVLLIFANKLGGNVDIINGLNHYIGMQTLHSENFIEFTVLPYIISFFALFALLVVILNKKKMLYAFLTSFVLFGVLAMVDFYRWNYDYGHNLNPDAAIKVPGMAYQPPLIGYKQLLNFGAYSVPDIGGWLFIGAGLLMVIAVLIETGLINKIFKHKSLALIVTSSLFLVSCTNTLPKPVKLNIDQCDHCKMTIVTEKFAAECITQKGRIYKFDDLLCCLKFMKSNNNMKFEKVYVADYNTSSHFLVANEALLINSDAIKSPMGGHFAAFSSPADEQKYSTEFQANSVKWTDLIK